MRILTDNRSVVVKKMYDRIKPLASSYERVVLNHKEIIHILLDSEPIFCLDLLGALIKDLWSDLYDVYIETILPRVIGMIDIEQPELLD